MAAPQPDAMPAVSGGLVARRRPVFSSPNRILIIALRRLGDLLLATGLIRSLRQQWPQAQLDILVSAGSEAILEGNPDLNEVLLFRRGERTWPLLRRITRRYDLSVSLQPEDRAQWLALAAAPQRASIVPSPEREGAGWKRWINQAWHPVDLHDTHAVEQYLRLVDAMGVPRCSELVPPRSVDVAGLDAKLAPLLGAAWRQQRYAVLHASPMFRYKAWPDAAWQQLAQALIERGLTVVLSGGPEASERERVAGLRAAMLARGAAPEAVVDLAGQLRLAQWTWVLERCAVFVGPDTSVTHLAAATGAPTVALFGPSNPTAWGPWPQGGAAPGMASPWQRTAAAQSQANVQLLQGTQGRTPGCIPCLQEGCERRRDSVADCLETLPPARVMAAVAAVLPPATQPSG